MYVIKSTGEKEAFNPGKIMRTLLRAGASKETANEIIRKVRSNAYNGIPTREILNSALDMLKGSNPGVCARYDLKRAILNLGPTGFPFEKFFAEVLKNYGYGVQTDRIIKGKLISHEIDVVAKKDRTYMVECKYHNAPGIYTDVKVALYVYARFLDLRDKFDVPWLATDTNFSRSVIRYAEGVGMKLTSWKYPKKESLSEMITQKKLYPITVLKSVNNPIKIKLSQAGIMLTKNLIDIEINKLKRVTGLPINTLQKIVQEAKSICEYPEEYSTTKK